MSVATKKQSDKGTEQLPEKIRRGRYPLAYRRDIAALVLDQGRTIKDVCEEFDLKAPSVSNWVRQERVERGERQGLTSAERAQMAQMQREIKKLRQERDLLKKAMAFWVKDADH